MRGKVVSKKGLRGLARVRKLGSEWQVDLDGEVFSFDEKDAPSGVQAGKFHVALSGRGDRWYSISPVEGTFKGRFANFGGRPGEAPKPMVDPGGWKKGKDGREFLADPSMSMMGIFEITTKSHRGMTGSTFLPYIFVQDETNPRFASYQGTKGQVEKIERFLAAAGFTEDDNVKYDDEPSKVLADLQALLQARKAEAEFLIEDGRITKFFLDNTDQDDEDEDEAPVKPRQRSARGKAPAKAPAKKSRK